MTSMALNAGPGLVNWPRHRPRPRRLEHLASFNVSIAHADVVGFLPPFVCVSVCISARYFKNRCR